MMRILFFSLASMKDMHNVMNVLPSFGLGLVTRKTLPFDSLMSCRSLRNEFLNCSRSLFFLEENRSFRFRFFVLILFTVPEMSMPTARLNCSRFLILESTYSPIRITPRHSKKLVMTEKPMMRYCFENSGSPEGSPRVMSCRELSIWVLLRSVLYRLRTSKYSSE